MKAIVSEPTTIYKTSKWKVNIGIQDRLWLTRIDNLSVRYRQTKVNYMSLKKPQKKFDVTSLRGKMSKQTAEEIDKQIEELRNEWDRGF